MGGPVHVRSVHPVLSLNTLLILPAIIPSLYRKELRQKIVKTKAQTIWSGTGKAGFEFKLTADAKVIESVMEYFNLGGLE